MFNSSAHAYWAQGALENPVEMIENNNTQRKLSPNVTHSI